MPNYPLFIGAGFLLISVLLYWFHFSYERSGIVLVYVLLCIYALLLGSFLGMNGKIRPYATLRVHHGWLWLAVLLLSVNATVNITAFYSSFNDILRFIGEPGKAYEYVKFLVRNGQGNESVFGGIYGPLITMLAFTKYVVFGWTVLCWGELSKPLRLVAVASMLYYSVHVILIGAMVNVATVFISTLVVVVAKSGETNKKKRRRILLGGIAASGMGFMLLSLFRGAREEGVTGFSERVVTGADGLIYYVAHGYVGLGYSLGQPFESTGGATAFYGFARLFTDELSPSSYLARTELAAGWSASQVWSTAAPWLASDFTFLGVPLILLIVGICAGRLWKLSVRTLDPFALLLLGQLIIGVYFFPANNHLLQTFANASGFFIIIILYLLTRRRVS